MKVLFCYVTCAVLLLGTNLTSANPAPAPMLQTPAANATNVDPDGWFGWRWVDDLVANGSFESGLTPGWYTGGQYPSIWKVYTSSTNAWGMGYRFVSTDFSLVPVPAYGQIIQDIYVPADATSATLSWKEWISNHAGPSQLIARFRVFIYQGGVMVDKLEDATGTEPRFLSNTWVPMSTNLLAYAGQTIQLVFQANSYSPLATSLFWVNVDGVTFTCEHSNTPEFQVLLGKTSLLRATNEIGSTTALSFAARGLDPQTVYYWKVGAVRDGVTNYSTTAAFKTGNRLLLTLTIVGRTDTGIRLSFPSRADHFYTIEQRDTLDDASFWSDLISIGQGTGAPMEVEAPSPSGATAFWRLRVEQ